MPPHITEYLDFVEDKSLFILLKNGDIIIDPKMSNTLGKLYLYIYWDKYIKMGNSPSTLWNAMSSIKNETDPIRFDTHGYQANKNQMLELDSPYFLGAMAEDNLNKYWFGILRISMYLILIGIGIYFVQNMKMTDATWAHFISLSKINPFIQKN